MFRLVGELYSYWNILRVQIWVELKLSVTNTRFGYLWWLLDPLFLMAVYYFVMNIVFPRKDPDYHIFLLCGLVPWQWFARSLSLGTTALSRNGHLIRQTGTPLSLYLLAPVLIQMVFAIFGFIIVISFVFDIYFPGILLLVPLFFLQIVLTFGTVCFLSVLNVYFPDTQHFVAYTLRLGLYLSPILYGNSRVLDSDRIPQIFKALYLCNPLTTLIPAYRDIIMYDQIFEYKAIVLWTIIGLILLHIGLTFLRLQHRHIPKMI